mgnify:CR=1 FL=1
MAGTSLVMGSFRDIDPTVEALDRLRELGIPEENISVLSHIPLSERVLGRPHRTTWLPTIALVSAALGLLIGLFFVAITPNLYVIRVAASPSCPFRRALCCCTSLSCCPSSWARSAASWC